MKTLIKNTFLDISLVFRNFIHWNTSKVIILLEAALLWTLITLPLILIYFISTGFSITDLYILVNSIFFNWQWLNSFFAELIYIVSYILFSVSFLYSYVLLIKINKSYIEWKKEKILNKIYLDYKLFFKYLRLAFLYLFISLPIIVSLIICLISIWAMWWTEAVLMVVSVSVYNSFTIIFWILFAVSIILTVYLWYRFIFAFFLLSEEENKEKWLFKLLKESFKITSGYKKLLKLILLSLVILLALTPFNYLGSSINSNNNDIINYVNYSALTEDQKLQVLSWNNGYYFNEISVKYDQQDLEVIKTSSTIYAALSLVFTIFNFLVLNGLLLMMLTSFYNRNLIKK